MKRQVFFWLEKLNIHRGERKAVAVLLVILFLLFFIHTLMPATSSFDDDYYASLDEAFKKRSELLRQKEETILARYRPRQHQRGAIARDTVPKDTQVTKKRPADSTPAAVTINVNTADAKTLQRLHGIGPAYARRIIEYRQKNGTFNSYEELLKIKGIGKKRLEKLLPFIQLKEPTENK